MRFPINRALPASKCKPNRGVMGCQGDCLFISAIYATFYDMSKYTLQAVALLFLLGIVWGSGYSIAHYATTHGVSPIGYAFWQSLGPALVLTLLCQSSPEAISLSKKQIPFYLVCGLIGIAIPNTNMYFAAKHLPAGLLAVVVNTVPIMTYLMAFAIKEENFSWPRLFGVLSCVAGIMLLIFPGEISMNTHETPWILASLLTPFSFALCAVYSTKFRPVDGHSLTLSAGMLIVSTLLLVPIVFASKDFYPLWPPFHLQDWLIIVEIILSSAGYVIFFRLLKIAGAVFYSLVGGVVSLTGLVWGWVFFQESLDNKQKLAILCILLGIVIVPLFKNKKPKGDEPTYFEPSYSEPKK